MKINCFAAAMAVLFSGSVCAQASPASSVVLYGVADIGVEYLTNAQGTDKGVVRAQSGNHSGSRFGLMGKEDLGGGVKAIFTLEAGFDLGTGKSSQGGRLFGRQAFVGLNSSAGQITFGRQYSTMHDIMFKYDPMQHANYSVYPHDPGMAARVDKAIKYEGTFDTVTVGGFYSFGRDTTREGMQGERPYDRRHGRQWGLGVNYSDGPIGFGVAYDSVNGAGIEDLPKADLIDVTGNAAAADISWITSLLSLSTNSNNSANRISVGASYNFGPAKVFLGYRNLKSEFLIYVPTPFKRFSSNLYWGGVSWQATPETTLTGAVYHARSKDTPRITSYVLSADYNLSKRTDIYTSLTYVDNNKSGVQGSNMGANPGESTLAGKDQFGTQVGIRHRF